MSERHAISELLHEKRTNEYVAAKLRWLFATLLLASVFLLGVAGFGLAGFGPCTARAPWVLFFSAALSGTALYASIRLLSAKQRKPRLKTVPFYVCFVAAALFIVLQILLLVFL